MSHYTDPLSNVENTLALENSARSPVGVTAAIAKYRKVILGVTGIALLITSIVVWFFPDTYVSTAVILNPAQNQSQNNLFYFLGLKRAPVGLGSARSIMLSTGVMKSIINQYNLASVYKEGDVEDLIESLRNNITISNSKDGVVSVTVRDTDPDRAANIANSLVEELEKKLRAFSLEPTQIRATITGIGATPAGVTKQTSAILGVLGELALISEGSFEKERRFVFILDKAHASMKKAGPQKFLIIGMGGLLAFFASILFAIMMEAYRRTI